LPRFVQASFRTGAVRAHGGIVKSPKGDNPGA
jgi:hypothetical protein